MEDAAGTGWGLESRYPLAWAACPIAIMTGDLDAAERALVRLADIRQGSNLAFWVASARCLEGHLLLHRGEHTRAAALLEAGLERCRVSAATRPAFRLEQ